MKNSTTKFDSHYQELSAPRTCSELSLSELQAQLKMTKPTEIKRIEYLTKLINNLTK